MSIYEKMNLCQACYAGIAGRCAPCGKDCWSAQNCRVKKSRKAVGAL